MRYIHNEIQIRDINRDEKQIRETKDMYRVYVQSKRHEIKEEGGIQKDVIRYIMAKETKDMYRVKDKR